MAVETSAAPRAVNLPSILKESVLAALVTLALAVPLVGFQTVDRGGVLTINTRFHWVAIAVVVVFAGRFLLAFRRAKTAKTVRVREGPGAFARFNAAIHPYIPWVAAAAVMFAFVLPFTPFSNRYVIDVATAVLIYVMLGWGLNIVVGLAGLLDLGFVAFYAVGAYGFALMAHYAGITFWTALPLTALIAAAAGCLLGFPVLRMGGDYLAIVTLGFGEIIRILLVNMIDITGGPNGMSAPRPTLFGLEFTRRAKPGVVQFHEYFGLEYSATYRYIYIYLVALAVAGLALLVFKRLREMPIGRAWEALREDEIACKALGINHTTTKLSAFTLGAAFGGTGGVLFAAMEGFINPSSFTFIESAIILSIVVLGGAGSISGVIVAAVAITLLPELFREFQQFRMLAFGMAMVFIMIWRPGGLLSVRRRIFSEARPVTELPVEPAAGHAD